MINTLEKMSTRLETLKKEDSLQNIDIIEHFWAKMKELKEKMGLKDLNPVTLCISDINYRSTFENLLSGTY